MSVWDAGLAVTYAPRMQYPWLKRNSAFFIHKLITIWVATTLSTFIIEKGGVVYGAAFDNAFNLLHSRIDSVKELHKIQGTKYVQSSIGYSYKQIKNDLKSKTVLFIGTPCQVAGLK